MGALVPEDDLPGREVPADDLPGGGKSKYEGYPISTFAANAVNALTFGLPDYLNKKFSPETYAEGEKYKAANPAAATAGQITGDIAGLAIPTGVGFIKGGQLGARAMEYAGKKFAPELASGQFGHLANLYGRAQGAATGGVMGAQLGATVPEIIQSNPAQAVAKGELINQAASAIPFTSPLGGVTGHIVPAISGALANYQMPGYTQLKQAYQRETTPQPQAAPQPPTADNFIERMKRLANQYSGVLPGQ